MSVPCLHYLPLLIDSSIMRSNGCHVSDTGAISKLILQDLILCDGFSILQRQSLDWMAIIVLPDEATSERKPGTVMDCTALYCHPSQLL